MSYKDWNGATAVDRVRQRRHAFAVNLLDYQVLMSIRPCNRLPKIKSKTLPTTRWKVEEIPARHIQWFFMSWGTISIYALLDASNTPEILNYSSFGRCASKWSVDWCHRRHRPLSETENCFLNVSFYRIMSAVPTLIYYPPEMYGWIKLGQNPIFCDRIFVLHKHCFGDFRCYFWSPVTVAPTHWVSAFFLFYSIVCYHRLVASFRPKPKLIIRNCVFTFPVDLFTWFYGNGFYPISVVVAVLSLTVEVNGITNHKWWFCWVSLHPNTSLLRPIFVHFFCYLRGQMSRMCCLLRRTCGKKICSHAEWDFF